MLEAPSCLRCLHWVATAGCALCLRPVNDAVALDDRLGGWPLRAHRSCSVVINTVLLDACREQQARLLDRLRTEGY